MNTLSGYIWMAVLCTLGLVVIGALFYAWLARRAVHIRQSIPANWPLARRPLVNSEESQVWHWMCQTFPMHQVNIKIPVTRFTHPLAGEQRENLYKLLNGVYCTFTVSAPDGRVVGCVDVIGVNGLASANCQLKQALLVKCGIAYRVLRPVSLPTIAEIRSDFLGEAVLDEPAAQIKPREGRYREFEEALLAEARLKLSTALNRQRRFREGEFTSLTPDTYSPAMAQASKSSQEGIDGKDLGLLPGWQRNSFLAPLDS
jgi:hypothetical protein